jgi:hypothetical protein
MILDTIAHLILPWLLLVTGLLYLRLPGKGEGYWTATLGALRGAGVGVLVGAIVGYLASDYLSRDQPDPIPGVWAIPFAIFAARVTITPM